MLASLLGAFLLAPRESQIRQALPPVEDTFLDATLPDANFGRELVVVGGANKAILLRFPALSYGSPSRRTVKSARLVLTSNGGPAITPSAVTEMRTRWFEGPGRGATKTDKPEAAATWSHSRSGVGGVKWDDAGASSPVDSRPISAATSEVKDGDLVISGLETVVQAWIDDPARNFGLRLQFDSNAVFKSAENIDGRPRLVVEFADPAPGSNADLAVESVVPSGQQWVATVRNVGSQAISGGRIAWSVNDKPVSETEFPDAIAAGSTKTFSFASPAAAPGRDQRVQWIAARVTPNLDDANPANNGLRVPMLGVPIEVSGLELTANSGWGTADLWVQDVITEINEHVLPHSRASFAPAGAIVRLRMAAPNEPGAVKISMSGKTLGDASEARRALMREILQGLIPVGGFATPPGSVFPYATGDEAFLGWFPDTRDDTGRIAALPMPTLYWMPRISDEDTVPMTGLLSMAELAILQFGAGRPHSEWLNGIYNLPKSAMLRCFDANALPLSDVTIEVFQLEGDKLGATPVYSTKATRQGSAILSSRPSGDKPNSSFGDLKPNGSNGWLLVKATSTGQTDSMWLPAWALWAEYARGNTGTATVECRFMLAPLAIDDTQDLALNKLVTDSRGRFPAELTALVDNNPATSVAIEGDGKPYWIEIDLGKDRTFCQIELQYSNGLWEKFDILTYGTSQTAASAFAWYREFGGTWQSQVRGKTVDGQTVVMYRANPNQTRYIRIIPNTDRPVSISGIRVRPVAAGN